MSEHALTRPGAELIGRRRELEALLDLSESDLQTGASVAVLDGVAGIGKSALLDVLSRTTRRHVVRVRGRRAGQLVPFGLITELVETIERTDPVELPAPLRDALTRSAAGDAADEAFLRLAVSTLVDEAGRSRPLLVLIDDVQDADPGSRAALAAVARRLHRQRATIVFAVRGEAPPDLARDAMLVHPTALDAADAAALLERQPSPPTGRRRVDVLRCAAGNPLAIVELARDRSTASVGAAPGTGAVALSDRLTGIYSAELSTLPPRTRQALLLAAAGESRLSVLQSPPLQVVEADWEVAETAGIVSLRSGLVRFPHPLIESAVYDSASEDERARAHAALADAVADEPGLTAWHRSACTTTPDEATAQALSGYGEQVVASGDSVTAALVLQRAAEITPDRRAAAVRRLRAAELAGIAGQSSWVAELVAPIAADGELADLHPSVAGLTGWLHIMQDEPGAAVRVLLDASKAVDPGRADVLDTLLGTVALPVYALGTVAARERLTAELRRVGAADVPVGALSQSRRWATVVGRPDEAVVEWFRAVVADPHPVDPKRFLAAMNAGAATLVLDETDRCITHLEPIAALLRRRIAFHPAMTALAALGWGYLDAARFPDAEENARTATEALALAQAPVVTGVATVQRAIVALVHDDDEDAVTAGEHVVGGSANPALRAQLAWAQGRAAAAHDDGAAAWSHLRRLYDDAGAPVHVPVGLLAVADLCSAGARFDRLDEARTVLEQTRAARSWQSRRQRLIFARAEAVLAADGIDLLQDVVGDSAAGEWPFDRALGLVDLGVSLRRTQHARQVQQARAARDALYLAVDAFVQLGAPVWEQRARTLLRATGERVAPPVPHAFAALTEQQQRILRLAAAGLSNQEIADELYLSARTVGSHLYRAFPKLGITKRSQLPSVVDPGR